MWKMCVITGTVLGLGGCLETTPVLPNAELATSVPPQIPAGSKLNDRSAYIDLWKYSDSAHPRNPSANYTTIVANVRMNPEIKGANLLEKFASAVGYQNTNTVAFSMKRADYANDIVIAALTNSSKGLSISTNDDAVISPAKTYSPADQLTIVVKTTYGDAVQSSIISNAVEAGKIVSGILGAAPAAAAIALIPAGAISAGDNLISTLGNNNAAFNPAFTIDGNDLAHETQWHYYVYDKPYSSADMQPRTWLAHITIGFKEKQSLLASVDSNGKFQKIQPRDIQSAHIGADTLATVVSKSYNNSSLWRANDYQSYYTYCDNLEPALLSLQFNSRDIAAAEWAMLYDARGGAKFVGRDMCPSQEELDQIHSYGLNDPKLPIETAAPAIAATTAALNGKLSALSTALSNGGLGLDSLMGSFVTVFQSVPAFPSLLQGRDNNLDTVGFKQVLANMGGTMRVTPLQLVPSNPLAAQALLIIGNQQHFLLATWDGNQKLIRLEVRDQAFAHKIVISEPFG